ncbi:MAG: division/cell wall cluster transcriptional repressor MraZ [Lachnospiraceae bacterium]|nr:division/cell wall cluster transcriptional repressor MraZ [Lachnospiraceae bacterium]
MFSGFANHKIDAKGRMIVPSKFREELGDSFVVTKGLDGCLYIYPNEEWGVFLEKLHTLPSSKDTRKIVRFFAAGADNVEVDGQGRILIRSDLREYAGLQKDVVLAGTFERIEIWDKERWDQENSGDENIDEIAEKMVAYGF